MEREIERRKDNVKREPLAKLFQGGELYCPDFRGQCDLLVVGNLIARIAPKIPIYNDFLDLEVINAIDKIIVPGFIDQHVHLIGAGGVGGPISRTREIKIQQITQAGVTTVVGCLGLDRVTRSLGQLLVKAIALELQGITSFIYTGSYIIPPATITGSIQSDILLINKVVGIKLAIAEASSTYPSLTNPFKQDLIGILADALRGGILSGKPGIVHIHIGGVPAIGSRCLKKYFMIV